ncbi:HAD hydrolase-like protein [Sphingomonas sp. RS6]
MAEPGTSGAPLDLVIFDFDGTLSDSGDWFVSVANQLAERFRFRRVESHEVEMLRRKSSREVIEFLGISRWKMPMIARHVRRLVSREAHRIELFPGTPDLLERLAATGVKLALVTSNSEANARRILGPQHAARIDFFACGSSLFGKAPKFRRVLRKMGVAPHATLAIGDETRDVDAAREVGIRAGSVLWGYAAEDLLRSMAPDALFSSPQDILDYVRRHRP